MSKNKTAKEKRPWHILIWLILYLVNLLAALAFQYFFHSYILRAINSGKSREHFVF